MFAFRQPISARDAWRSRQAMAGSFLPAPTAWFSKISSALRRGTPNRSNGSISCEGTRCSCPSPTIATWRPSPTTLGWLRFLPSDRVQTARTAPVSNGRLWIDWPSCGFPQGGYDRELTDLFSREASHEEVWEGMGGTP